jgi:thioredoxin 1
MSAINIDKNNFEEILKSDKPVLIDFWAPWCSPCRMQGPIVEELAQEMAGKAIVAKLNVDENQDIAQKYGVMSIPTLIILKNGKVAAQKIGVTEKSLLAGLLHESGA